MVRDKRGEWFRGGDPRVGSAVDGAGMSWKDGWGWRGPGAPRGRGPSCGCLAVTWRFVLEGISATSRP